VRILITGGAGFIGSNFVRHMLKKHKNYEYTVYDLMTYASNPDNIKEFDRNKNFRFIKGDICDRKKTEKFVKNADVVVNFAAETHVDRSILGPPVFVQTNINGTDSLLNACRIHGIKKYIQISTDEVYGSVKTGKSKETDRMNPSSPYSSSKAAADLVALAYYRTFGVPVIITRSSNNFGPYQHPEKFIPLFITNAVENRKMPLYGDGKNIRNWIYVDDNCSALDIVLHRGKPGEVYNIGGNVEMKNIDVAELILKLFGKKKKLIQKVKDRPAHDRRYALDSSKVKKLGWKPAHNFRQALDETISWYVKNEVWWEKLKNKAFKKYYSELYRLR